MSAAINLTDEEIGVLKAILARIEAAAAAAGLGEIPDDYWPLLATIESGNRPYIKAASSSASGLYQFIRTTWLDEGGTVGGRPEPGVRRAQAVGRRAAAARQVVHREECRDPQGQGRADQQGVAVRRALLRRRHGREGHRCRRRCARRPDRRRGRDQRQPVDPQGQDGRPVPELAPLKTGDWAR
jgi:hypothetical protein